MMTHKMHRTAIWLACVSAAVLAGCASDVKLNDNVPVETRTPTANSGTGGTGSGAQTGQSSVATVDAAAMDAAAAAANRIVYFDFDSFVVKDDYRAVVETNAKVLNGNRQKRLAAEGHTDERGGREYNLALGQKRAEAVQRAMVLLGVADNQVEAVSFGEERPAATGSSEEAWAKNRRVELKDR